MALKTSMPPTLAQLQRINANRAQAATGKEATLQNALRQQQQPRPPQPQQVTGMGQRAGRAQATLPNALRQQQQPQPPQPQQVPPPPLLH